MHYMQHYYSLHFTYYLFFSLTKSLQLNLENSIYNLKISYLRADNWLIIRLACAVHDFQDQHQIVFCVMIRFRFL